MIVVDEIGKMELFSGKFEQTVRQLLTRSNVTVLATIPEKRRIPVEFAEEIRTSPTVRLFEVRMSTILIYTELTIVSQKFSAQTYIVNNRYHYDLRKFSFAPVNVWNSLPEIVISAATTDTFKRRLDKFWQHQDILYDYKINCPLTLACLHF